MSEFEKLDMGLTMALRAYRESADHDPDAGISVSLRFEGDLAAIEALGFETDLVSDDEAYGIVRFKDIPALVAHPGVIWIAAGQPPTATLWSAVTDIRARADKATDVGTQGLWYTPWMSAGPLTSVPKATGKGVIVAVLDTGIDYTHPIFMSQLAPAKRSRIVQIWDQGLIPTAYSQCPSPALLFKPNKTYGVEYKNDRQKNITQIDDALVKNATPLRHKDCDGHGTHVAGIAAGGKEFPTGGNAENVGVAPEANIIAVKVLDVPRPIKYYLPSNSLSNVTVGWHDRFKDAVLYCLRTAKALGKPVVINMSLGSYEAPGDGLDTDARWLDKVLDPTKPAGLSNFPKGAIFVAAAGNEGGIRESARIVVPSSGSITVPFRLEDRRGTQQTRWTECQDKTYRPSVGVHFWYRRTPVPSAVKFAVRLPHGAGFGNDKAVGGPELEIGFRHVAGPTPNDVTVTTTSPVPPTLHRAVIKHEDPGSVPHPAGGTVHRHHLYFCVKPRVSGNTTSYHGGTYTIRITAPQGTEVFALCEQKNWSEKHSVRFENAAPIPHSNIHPGPKYSANDTLGKHAITVAAYNEAAANHIAKFSSWGPLRDFSANPTPQTMVASKPNIAAPGVNVKSALGVHTKKTPLAYIVRNSAWLAGVRFKAQQGTSCAAPMVAGVIALMLQKKTDLNTTEVQAKLSSAPRPPVNPKTKPDSQYAYGVGMVDALTSHKNTP